MVRLVREHERCSLVVSVLGSGAKISRKEISRKEKKIPTHPPSLFPPTHRVFSQDRKSVVQGKSVDLGGGRIIKKKKLFQIHFWNFHLRNISQGDTRTVT